MIRECMMCQAAEYRSATHVVRLGLLSLTASQLFAICSDAEKAYCFQESFLRIATASLHKTPPAFYTVALPSCQLQNVVVGAAAW
jgi:hypothetical protein